MSFSSNDHRDSIELSFNETYVWEHLSIEEKIETLRDYIQDILRPALQDIRQELSAKPKK